MLRDWQNPGETMARASWWDKSGPNSDVVRHAPDDDNYHFADGRQTDRMRSGLETVIIPSATFDGRSMAFDGSKAGVVHVDPDAPDGGAVVDMASLAKGDVLRAMDGASYPHEVFYALGSSPGAPPRNAARSEKSYGDYKSAYQAAREETPVLPVAPQLPQSAGPVQSPMQVASPVAYHQQPQQPQQAYQPPYQPPAPQQPAFYAPPAPPAYYPPPQVDQGLQNTLSQVLQGLSALSARMDGIESRPAKTREPAGRRGNNGVATLPVGPTTSDSYSGRLVPTRGRNPEDEEEAEVRSGGSVFEDDAERIGTGRRRRARIKFDERQRQEQQPQHVDEYMADDEEADRHRSGVIVGFESLKLPYVTGPQPIRPKRKVIFDFGESGKQSAVYHDVVDSLNCVVLVYDSRYEEGTQFEPPDLGPNRVVELHVLSLKKTYKVGSIGQSFSIGVFDCVAMVKAQVDQDLDYSEE